MGFFLHETQQMRTTTQSPADAKNTKILCLCIHFCHCCYLLVLLNVYLHKLGSELQVDLVLHQQLLWCSVPSESAEKPCELLRVCVPWCHKTFQHQINNQNSKLPFQWNLGTGDVFVPCNITGGRNYLLNVDLWAWKGTAVVNTVLHLSVSGYCYRHFNFFLNYTATSVISLCGFLFALSLLLQNNLESRWKITGIWF